MVDWIVAILIVIGSVTSALAALGIWRMPDLYMRIQTTTKSATLGTSAIVLAAALAFDSLGTSARAILVVGFLLLTAPVAAHMIGRAAYFGGIPLWDRSTIDEMRKQDERVER